jgi:ribosomal protein S18
MIVIDEDSEHYKRMTLIKWKQTLPRIKEEEALYCEKQLIEFANNKQTEEEALAEINKYLTEKGLINPNENTGDTSTEQDT